MRKKDKKAIIFMLTMLFASFIFLSDAIDKEFYITIYWTMFGIFSIVAFGYSKDRTRYRIDYIQTTIIYTLLYLIVSYLAGIVFGFSRVPYSLTLLKILKNISFPLISIIVEEVLRKTIIKNRGEYKSIFLLAVLTFSLVEIVFNVHSYTWNSALGIFEGISMLIIPTIAKNALLTYMTYNCGIYPSLIYHLLMELYIYFVPIVPDFGMYISSIISIIFPTIMYLKFNTFISKEKYIARDKKSVKKVILYTPIIIFVSVIVLLVSGFFKYYAIAIGSGSMIEALNVGDVVVVEKLKKEELDSINLGDILVYKHDTKIIVHRVVKIKNDFYRTKGDNNDTEDNYNILKSDVVGVVRFKIPYVGYPSVWLSRKLS